jgi:uncharacterized protein (DUF697 family)
MRRPQVWHVIPLVHGLRHESGWTSPNFRAKRQLAATFQAAPAGVRAALAGAQRIDLARKRRDCKAIIATAAGVGAVPIPFSDAFLLVPTQVTMMATVATGYALPVGGTINASIAATLTAGFGFAWLTVCVENGEFIPTTDLVKTVLLGLEQEIQNTGRGLLVVAPDGEEYLIECKLEELLS